MSSALSLGENIKKRRFPSSTGTCARVLRGAKKKKRKGSHPCHCFTQKKNTQNFLLTHQSNQHSRPNIARHVVYQALFHLGLAKFVWEINFVNEVFPVVALVLKCEKKKQNTKKKVVDLKYLLSYQVKYTGGLLIGSKLMT